MATVICLHKEDIRATAKGDIGICRLCGQETLYADRQEPRIIKRGYIDGVITELHPVLHAESKPAPPAPQPREERVPLASEKGSTAPPKPKGRSKLRIYYNTNKDLILIDYYALTLGEFFKKWHLSTKNWMKLKKEWKVTPKGLERRTKVKLEPPVSISPTQSLPPLPPFDNNWTSMVKIEWLKTYKELRLAGVSGEDNVRERTAEEKGK
ncbi:hypothetical protein ES703_105686 [subsurface metagenome]